MIQGFNYNSSHVAEIIEDFDISESGNLKCIIPVLMPNISTGDAKTTTVRVSNSCLANKDKTTIAYDTTISTANYINIYVPKWIRKQFDYDSGGNVDEGAKIIITFIEGNLTNIKVLGRYE